VLQSARYNFNVVKHICCNLVLLVPFFLQNMVDHILNVVDDYEKRLRRMLVVPLFSCERHWRCQRRVAGSRCNTAASIRYGSWFQQSNLTLFEILLLTYDFVCRVSASQIQNEYAFSANTLADWGVFCRETMLVFLEGCSV
jgi:hypothetical protein